MRNLCSCCFSKKPKHHFESPLTSAVSRRSMISDGPEIIIVGAGAAGLACAVKLIDNGFKNIKILEAGNRIGGRIHSVPFADGFVDLGAQWCHGQDGNVVYEMVEDLDLLETTGEIYFTFDCIRSNGEVIPSEQAEIMKEILEDIFLNERDLMAEYNGSFSQFLKTRFFAVLNEPEYENIDMEIALEFFENFQKMESSESAVGLDEISARGFTQYWECEGDYMLNWRNKGFKEFIRVLTRAESNNDVLGILKKNVVLGAKVQKIHWDQNDGMVRVICEGNDKPFLADNVVVTVSLGVLKQSAKAMFEPPLPRQKLIAIEGLGYGDVLKIFIEFPYRFWSPTWTGFATLWRKEDLKELHKQNMLWMQEIHGFFPVNEQPRILLAWACGPAVPHIEKLPPSELQMHVMNIMRRFLIDWNVPEPISILATSWNSDKKFCGAYSFPTLYSESLATSANALAKPVNTLLNVLMENPEERGSVSSDDSSGRITIKPTLLFAGEATSSHYFSTVHGAVESGWREAKRLVGYYESEL